MPRRAGSGCVIGHRLRGVVQARLELDWSPEQIATWLRRVHKDNPHLASHHRSTAALTDAADV
jgi:IS30 family transposase